MLATLTLLLGLPLALATEPPTCAPLVPITFDNTTVPRLLGQWFYIGGASRYPPHLAELKAVTFAAFSFFPGSSEDELNITEIMRLNGTCVVRNSKLQVLQQNSTVVHVDDNQVASMATLIQSDKDLLILNEINIDSPTLSLSARTPNVSKEHMEEFKAHLHCLGFTEEDMFYTSIEDACPLPGEKTDEGDADP
ncbi:alpha-1-acid glycoprotein 2-like isoform X1 [Empidonax traillii]|uniref:alpha-1-acid glycoprotein 2-like isoform X1 n=1 Tax=Empidonax traillii TaxID=164674 RepID=UPI000FFD3BAB|nr:alpha-1-acid glycoprotein 2-like isoform X1 [Empidonax traillii]